MRRANQWKFAFCGELGVAMDAPAGWITQEQLFARLKERGYDDITARKLERWRNEGVFPAVLQIPMIRGSIVYYPPESCEQAIAVSDLLAKKRKFEYVGWELWWRGFWADEKHWKLRLERTASILERNLKLVRKLIAADEDSDLPNTIFDRAAKVRRSNFLLSRIIRRVGRAELPAVHKVVLATAAGQFDGYYRGDTEREKCSPSYDEKQMIEAADFGQSESDGILGQKLNLIESLVETLRDLSRLFDSQSLTDIVKRDDSEINRARDDARNALRLALSFYEATKPISGPQAFGLRLIAWLARKYDRATAAVLIIGLAGLRRISHNLLPSDQIARLAEQAEELARQSSALKSLRENDPRFAKVLHPKRLRRGLRDGIAQNALLKEIRAATMG